MGFDEEHALVFVQLDRTMQGAHLVVVSNDDVTTCVEINQCVGCRQFFTKSFLGDDAAVLAHSSRRCVDGVEVDVTIQDERAVNF